LTPLESVLALAHPPVVGGVYLVPVVSAAWCGRADQWPVIQAQPHSDLPGVRDWHLDYRFLTEGQELYAAAVEAGSAIWDHMPEHDGPNRWPGSRAARQLTMLRLSNEPDFPAAVLRPLTCRRPTIAPEPLSKPWTDLGERHGNPAPCLRGAGGRLLCPHQKMDLTHWPREPDGTIICPLHRLRVDPA
jgi:hypothetical protein